MQADPCMLGILVPGHGPFTDVAITIVKNFFYRVTLRYIAQWRYYTHPLWQDLVCHFLLSEKMKNIPNYYASESVPDHLQGHNLSTKFYTPQAGKVIFYLSLVKISRKTVSVIPSPVFCILPSSCLLYGGSSSRNQSCSGYIWAVSMHTRCSLHSHGHGSTRTSGRTLKQRHVRWNNCLPLISMYIHCTLQY